MSIRLLVSLALVVGFGSAQTPVNSVVSSSKPVAPAQAEPPHPPLTPETRGDIYMARKMYREAIDTFREGSPKDPVLLNKIGIAYHQLLQLDNAKKCYEQALKIKKDYAEAMNNLGTVYYARKSFRRAISWYKKALKTTGQEPKAASIYMNLGTAYFGRKKYKEASAAYQTALKLDPDVFERHSNYGVMLEERTVEERAKFHFYLAKLYAKDGRNDLALQYLRKALEEGFKEKKKLLEAPEFAGIKDTPEFKELLAMEPRVL